MADPQALLVCVAAQQAVHFVGLPEANLALAQAVVHLATAPKSNALYEAYSRVQQDVQQTRNEPVPLQIRKNLFQKSIVVVLSWEELLCTSIAEFSTVLVAKGTQLQYVGIPYSLISG